MTEKLNAGDLFPNLRVNVVNGQSLELPQGLEGKYKIILFHRGHW